MDVAITFYLQYGLSEICYQLTVCLMSLFYKKLFARQKNKITIEISNCNRWIAELAICIDGGFGRRWRTSIQTFCTVSHTFCLTIQQWWCRALPYTRCTYSLTHRILSKLYVPLIKDKSKGHLGGAKTTNFERQSRIASV